ncbi:aminoglycoside 6-adenylyltransferase [Paenibacillus polymyxa]|uniref:aminoglycoside 6-adenylyltransferase n=1 Tax=Paenibacillus polymyxa TaxID=1406 RepID=UPI0005CE8C96|nr:aminoglycoside 6-adenylyltransferase [Paenibacillus polymyxa]KAE8557736.1 hypothetical protein BJH92_24735 [Paenibacillus polymyxa]KJD39814.1 hypothetical protein QD46_12665 [Paenibacillus polymyxa]MBZ6446159.1 aminoglycoside 6-adenylyltransferase [Paenibacillus polymyxa]MBZ6452550.1 aminoglycoside 6-adenylyltransferase [Paenibacillus polymyxa]MCJ1223153.1 aminoglycoside 6-adenylyltransferase [Paenibacillus polymyxa]
MNWWALFLLLSCLRFFPFDTACGEIQTNFTADPGKQGKYFEKHLEPEHWTAYIQTFADADYEHMWQSLFIMGNLFREVAQKVANHYGYRYPIEDDQRVTNYLYHVKALPADTTDIY